MDRHIEGFCNFKNGDKLEVDGIVKAEIVQLDNSMYLDFNDGNLTRMYLGEMGDPNIDVHINIAWSVMKLKWNK